MVSGVGPASELQSLGIPVVADLKGVGQEMRVSYSYNRRSSELIPIFTSPSLKLRDFLPLI